jgi:hypothetical protein
LNCSPPQKWALGNIFGKITAARGGSSDINEIKGGWFFIKGGGQCFNVKINIEI